MQRSTLGMNNNLQKVRNCCIIIMLPNKTIILPSKLTEMSDTALPYV